MFTDENIKSIISSIENASKKKDTDCFCLTRDVFQARVDSYVLRTNRYLESAIIGEIGNNTFDHNWDYAEGHLRGTYLNLDGFENVVILADFGRGIRNSLEKVYKTFSDEEAVKIAFTKQISGRAPEQRGNGLKFVLENVKNKNWSLYFQSGSGCCIINNGDVMFKNCNFKVIGCISILVFGGDKNEFSNK